MDSASWVLGMMSGTSMDGIDAALLRTDGQEILGFGASFYRAFSQEEKPLLIAAKGAAQALKNEPPLLTGVLADAGRLVSRLHAETAGALIAAAPPEQRPGLIGFHGQTVVHRPEKGWTLQIGDGREIAAALNIDVAGQFRLADVKSGGEGAPLIPVYHQALCRHLGLAEPALMVNLGGVSNITLVSGKEASLLAFDTGPGNALIDDWVKRHFSEDFDRGGELAAKGRADEKLIARWLALPFFERPPPKSLDRDAFLDLPGLEDLAPIDGAATLTAFTAAALAEAFRHFPEKPKTSLVMGGGARNKTLMTMLGQRTGLDIKSVETCGLAEDKIEAQGFAFLAARVRAGLPLSFPGTTGVAGPCQGGEIYPGR